MPRRRRSLQGAVTPASERLSSVNGSRNETGRLTRSSSSKRLRHGDSIDVTGAPSDSTPTTTRPRGRFSRPPILINNTAAASPASTNIAPPSAKHSRGRPSKASVAGSESVSSVPTPVDASSDSEYSTPATSKVPTPVATDGHASSRPAMSFEVRLPAKTHHHSPDSERALRTSIYSLNAGPNRNAGKIMDTDDDDDFSDTSPDAETARRLQQEEFTKAGMATMPQTSSSSRGGRPLTYETQLLCPLPTRAAPKRGRASTRSTTRQAPPAKRSKVIPDSDDLSTSDINMDAEITTTATLDSDELSEPFVSEDEPSFANSDEFGELDQVFGSDSEDEPLSSVKRGKQPAKASIPGRKGRVQAKAPLKSGPRKPVIRLAIKKCQLAALPDDADEGEDLGGESVSSMDTSGSDLTSISSESDLNSTATTDSEHDAELENLAAIRRAMDGRRGYRRTGNNRRLKKERDRLETHHPEITTMWERLEDMPVLKAGMAQQPQSISRQLKPFQLEGVAWMKEMERLEWKGGLLGDEMGLGKTIQAVSLIMSDYPAKQPSLVLVPPVALMQWQSEIKSYTDGTLKTFVYHGTNQKAKGITVKELKKYNVIMMSYNSLESMYRKQERGFKRKNGIHKEKSVIHSIHFHRVILDEAHCIKTRTTMTAKACFALKTDFRWCLTGTPLQNRIGEFFSLIRFLNVKPFASYLCKQCPCSSLEWTMNDESRCTSCGHAGMQHVSVFNQELLNPIQKFGNLGPGRDAFRKLRLMTERIMLRRLKKDHTNSMELPVKEIYVDRQFFGEEENDFANSIMTNGQRKFDTYVAQGVLLNNYANIFGLIMQMRQVADHPDLILKKNAEGGQNVLVCCICDEPAEDTVCSRCKHDFCRTCVASYVRSTDEPDCPRCHIPLSIDLEQPGIEQDETLVKKNSIINRIKMENWTSSSKIELLVHELHKLRSDNASHKSIIFSQFTTMLQLIEWRLRRAGITTVMLDGSMTPAQRQASIEHFMTNVDVECFLVSLKAGGVALNLTEASRVFIVDPWWNPAAEWQSADRCHRIGQTRPCTITRLCIEDSVESRMVLIQEKKTNMINSTVNADDKAMESLTPEDMQFLFRGS
ncbi:DNA repair protein RAD16 [Tolypocladium capitatum]|uniref:DNA repair protein RAD16 n=1 Tax=Tolypocladium capitatum TaxID=45235 RepID=A0A2K3QQY1_9HYPO|nr:DNA repair protein RAD16 [Tolypocladium capitatum]